MNADLTPDAPTPTFTRSWRTGTVLYALALVGLGAWQVSTNVPVPWFAVMLSAVSVALIIVGTARLWRWADQPRLSSAQQRTITNALRGDDRRAMARAVRRSEAPPAHLRGWALPYAQLQQQLVVTGCFILLLTANSVLPVASEPHVHVGGWIELGIAASTLSIAAGLVLWARRATVVAARWASHEEVAPSAAFWPQRFPPGATPPTVLWRDGEPQFNTDDEPEDRDRV